MHIERNVFDNVFYTMMNDRGKTKDIENACRDLKLLYNRSDLHLKEHGNGRFGIAKGKYRLDKNQIKAVYEWISNLKFSDEYASNISKLVNLMKGTFKGMKSHDCHVFM